MSNNFWEKPIISTCFLLKTRTHSTQDRIRKATELLLRGYAVSREFYSCLEHSDGYEVVSGLKELAKTDDKLAPLVKST